MKVYDDISELVGNTPLVKLNKVTNGLHATVLAKLEFYNPASSVKDRLAYAMIKAAEESGDIDKETLIVEPTSGNTGIGLAFMCAVKGYKLIVTMPESVSVERRNLIRSFGAKVVLTPADKGMKGSIAEAEKIAGEAEKSFIPMQFKNMANAEMHRKTTAIEIWNDTNGKVGAFVAGAGTGGTITGVSEVLKQKNPAVHCAVVEPSSSAVISGREPGSHKIQGIGPGFIPDVLITDNIDEIITVDDPDAFAMAKRLTQEEGILCGISSGANVQAAIELAKRPEMKDKVIVTIICDTGERYLSTPLFNDN